MTTYTERPWTKLYGQGLPTDITPDYPTMLDMFNVPVTRAPDSAGQIGEIATSGPQVVPGYWNKPEATAESLPGGELRTGDVGFMDRDGWFCLVGPRRT